MYEFWYDYVKPEYGENEDIAGVETRFDTANFELNRPLPKGKSKKSK